MLLSQTRGKILNVLRELEEWGIINFEDKCHHNVTVNSGFDIPMIHSVAIELKLSSWEKALWQATRNANQFASSYVVMPKRKLALLKSKFDLFKLNNVGTAVFDVDSLTLTSINQSMGHRPITSRYYLEGLDCLMRNLAAFERV